MDGIVFLLCILKIQFGSSPYLVIFIVSTNILFGNYIIMTEHYIWEHASVHWHQGKTNYNRVTSCAKYQYSTRDPTVWGSPAAHYCVECRNRPWPVRQKRIGRMVSDPFPVAILHWDFTYNSIVTLLVLMQRYSRSNMWTPFAVDASAPCFAISSESWYCLCGIKSFLSFSRNVFNDLCHHP